LNTIQVKEQDTSEGKERNTNLQPVYDLNRKNQKHEDKFAPSSNRQQAITHVCISGAIFCTRVVAHLQYPLMTMPKSTFSNILNDNAKKHNSQYPLMTLPKSTFCKIL
jgi:hypothetical protein